MDSSNEHKKCLIANSGPTILEFELRCESPGVALAAYRSRDDRDGSVAFADGQKRESSVKKSIKFVVVCAAPLLAAGIALPSASADPTNAPGPGPTVANQPPDTYTSIVDGRDAYLNGTQDGH